MRGKRARAKANRDLRALQAEIDSLHKELAAERARATAAAEGARQVEAAQQRLNHEKRLTRNRLHQVTEAAARRAAGALRTREQLASALREIRAAEAALQDSISAEEVVEHGAKAGVPLRLTNVHPKAPTEFKALWYRAKAHRQTSLTRDIWPRGWIPEDAEDNEDQQRVYAECMPTDTHPQACWAWAVPPWMRVPTAPTDAAHLRATFGTTACGAPVLHDRSYPGRGLRPDAVLTAPWRHTPMVSHPADALDLAYWYQRSAWAQNWHPNYGDAMPMWLPAEHARSFPAARPLPDGVDLRLPFRLVFAALSSAWRIEPNRDQQQTHPLLQAAHPLFLHARGKLGEGTPPTLQEVLGRLQALGHTDRSELPSPLEFLDGYGGYVEGVLLTADEQGQPGDDIAWCVAIYHPLGMPLGRVTIPASRRRAGWRREVDNIIAGIALSCWHEPTALPSRASAGN